MFVFEKYFEVAHFWQEKNSFLYARILKFQNFEAIEL
jgi:hypothetical protein